MRRGQRSDAVTRPRTPAQTTVPTLEERVARLESLQVEVMATRRLELKAAIQATVLVLGAQGKQP